MDASQLELNKFYAGPPINMPIKFAYILKTLLLTSLYAPIAPIVVPIGLIGLILAYFI